MNKSSVGPGPPEQQQRWWWTATRPNEASHFSFLMTSLLKHEGRRVHTELARASALVVLSHRLWCQPVPPQAQTSSTCLSKRVKVAKEWSLMTQHCAPLFKSAHVLKSHATAAASAALCRRLQIIFSSAVSCDGWTHFPVIQREGAAALFTGGSLHFYSSHNSPPRQPTRLAGLAAPPPRLSRIYGFLAESC